MSPPAPTAPREPGEGRQGDVAVDGLVEEEALALALLRREADPGRDGGGHRPGAQRAAVDGAIRDQLVEVISVHRGVLAHREVVEDQDQRFGVFADALTPGAICVTASQV